MQSVNLSKAALFGTTLTRANLANADLTGVILKSLEIKDEKGQGTGRIQKSNFDNADLSGVDLSNIDLTQCSMDDSKFDK